MMHYHAVNEHAQILTWCVVYDTNFGLRKYVLVIPFSPAPKFVQLCRHMGRLCEKIPCSYIKLNTALVNTLSAIFLFYPSLSFKALYKPQTSKQFKVFRWRGLTCVDIHLASACYSVSKKLSNFTHFCLT